MILETQARTTESIRVSSDKFTSRSSFHDRKSTRRDACCHGCGELILDREVLTAGGLQWHSSMQCLRCDECGDSLQFGSRCVVNEDKIFCCQDHKRLFGKRCKKCDVFISPDEFVVCTKERDLFHVSCFVCVVCLTNISSGQQYGQMEGRIYCKPHFESLAASLHLESPPFCIDSSSVTTSVQPIVHFNTPPSLDSTTNHSLQEFDLQTNQNSGYNYAENVRCRPKRRKTPAGDSFVFPPTDPFDEQYVFHDSNPVEFLAGEEFQFVKEGKSLVGVYSNNSVNNSNSRQKRLRTSFKHHQLRTMKNYFAVNHNPDAKDLKELAQKTGLTKRVLQVWFQNARAKFRRNVMKQDLERSEDVLSCRDDGPSSITDKSHTSSESPQGSGVNRSTLKGLKSPSLSDVSTPSLGHQHQFDEEDSSSALTDLARGFLNS